VQEKIELSSIFTKTKVELNQNFRRSLLNYKDKATIKNCIKSSQGLQQAGILLPGVGHPISPHGYGHDFASNFLLKNLKLPNKDKNCVLLSLE